MKITLIVCALALAGCAAKKNMVKMNRNCYWGGLSYSTGALIRQNGLAGIVRCADGEWVASSNH